jgi:hypothetical protein
MRLRYRRGATFETSESAIGESVISARPTSA